MAATNQMWPLSTWYVASVTEKLNSLFYFVLMEIKNVLIESVLSKWIRIEKE